MLVQDLNGDTRRWTPKNRPKKNASKLHIKARTLLESLFPAFPILEEVAIKPRSQTLYLDIFIPALRLCVEVHGQQHYTFNTFHHKSKLDFYQKRKNDVDKEQFCTINKIEYLVFAYNETEEEWTKKIQSLYD